MAACPGGLVASACPGGWPGFADCETGLLRYQAGVCGSGSTRKARSASRPSPHSSHRDPSCVSIPRTLVTSMSRCARDPPPREPSPRCARGAPGGEREPHPVKKAPVPPPFRLQLKRLEVGGGKREVLAGAEAGVAGVAPPRLPPARPLRGLAYILPFLSGRGRPPGGVRDDQGRDCRSTPRAEKWGAPPRPRSPPVYPSAPSSRGSEQSHPARVGALQAAPRAGLRPCPLTRFLTSAESP